jgi:hypothetical protein
MAQDTCWNCWIVWGKALRDSQLRTLRTRSTGTALRGWPGGKRLPSCPMRMHYGWGWTMTGGRGCSVLRGGVWWRSGEPGPAPPSAGRS